MKILRRLPRTQLAIYGFYLLLAVLVTWPLVTQLSTRLVGDDTSDAYEMARHIWWFRHALQTGQPLFFQPLLGYPDGISGVSLWADPLQFFPAWLFAFIMPVPSAYNLTVLLTLALNGWALYWLAAYLLRRAHPLPEKLAVSLPALIGGAVFMLFPTMQGHLLAGHAGLLVMWPVPLYVYALLRLLEQPIRRWFALAVLFFVLSPGGHALQLIYVVLPITGVLLLALLWRRDWMGFLRALAVAVVGGLALLIFLLPVIGETVETSAYDVGGSVRYSIDLLGIVTPSFLHPFFDGLLAYPRRVLGINLTEGAAYVGVAAGGLGLIALFSRRAARWWGALALVAWALALGPLLKLFDAPLAIGGAEYESFIPLPFAALQDLPFFNLARTPGRFTFVLALALGVLAAYGAAVIFRRRQRWLLTGLLLAVITWEYQWAWPVPTVPAEIPQAVYDLAQREDMRAVFDIPWDHLLAAKDALYLQTAHEKPLIAGHVTRQTPVSPARLALLATLDPPLLDEAGADVVILHKTRADVTAGLLAREQLGEPFYEDARLALFDVPDPQAAPAFKALPAPDSAAATQIDSYLYAPEPGWVDFSANLAAEGRLVAVYLNGERLQTLLVDGIRDVHIPLPVGYAGYHSVTLALEPPCPQYYSDSEALRCRALQISAASLQLVSSGPVFAPVELAGGLRLAGSYLPGEPQAGGLLPVRLWWQFDAPRRETDIRFIHVLDASGQRVAQLDESLGAQPANSAWAERRDIPLPDDLPPGLYTVYVGWYTYPDLTRLDVLGDTPGAPDDLIFVGRFRVS